nr:recombination protein NinG [uncultured Rhodoferax sp.]
MTFNNRTRCPHCKRKLDAGQRIHPECIDDYAEAQAAKAERKKAKEARAAAKLERAETRRRREADQDIPDLIKIADEVFARYIRARDRLAGHPCVSSGKPLNWYAGNRVDAGHYRSRGAASHLRYHEDNCHAQSKQDNRFKSGNVVEYRIRLVQRIGLDRVVALEHDNAIHKWTREELRGIAKTYRQKFKELQA